MDAHSPLLPGRTVKLVSKSLGVARLQLTVRIKLSVLPKVRRSRPVNEAELVVEIQQQISEPLNYGYRRVWGLLRRARETQLPPAINVKRGYRVTVITTCCLSAGANSPVCRVHTNAYCRRNSNTRWW